MIVRDSQWYLGFGAGRSFTQLSTILVRKYTSAIQGQGGATEKCMAIEAVSIYNIASYKDTSHEQSKRYLCGKAAGTGTREDRG